MDLYICRVAPSVPLGTPNLILNYSNIAILLASPTLRHIHLPWFITFGPIFDAVKDPMFSSATASFAAASGASEALPQSIRRAGDASHYQAAGEPIFRGNTCQKWWNMWNMDEHGT